MTSKPPPTKSHDRASSTPSDTAAARETPGAGLADKAVEQQVHPRKPWSAFGFGTVAGIAITVIVGFAWFELSGHGDRPNTQTFPAPNATATQTPSVGPAAAQTALLRRWPLAIAARDRQYQQDLFLDIATRVQALRVKLRQRPPPTAERIAEELWLIATLINEVARLGTFDPPATPNAALVDLTPLRSDAKELVRHYSSCVSKNAEIKLCCLVGEARVHERMAELAHRILELSPARPVPTRADVWKPPFLLLIMAYGRLHQALSAFEKAKKEGPGRQSKCASEANAGHQRVSDRIDRFQKLFAEIGYDWTDIVDTLKTNPTPTKNEVAE